MLHLDYRDSRPIYEQVQDGLRKLMVAGVLQEGEKLPSVRTLASSLAINPNTIQRSYRQLEMEGWIVTVPGKGCFVCSDQSQTEAEKRKLLEEFDRLTQQLEAFGISRDTLVARLGKGGNEHA